MNRLLPFSIQPIQNWPKLPQSWPKFTPTCIFTHFWPWLWFMNCLLPLSTITFHGTDPNSNPPLSSFILGSSSWTICFPFHYSHTHLHLHSLLALGLVHEPLASPWCHPCPVCCHAQQSWQGGVAATQQAGSLPSWCVGTAPWSPSGSCLCTCRALKMASFTMQ